MNSVYIFRIIWMNIQFSCYFLKKITWILLPMMAGYRDWKVYFIDRDYITNYIVPDIATKLTTGEMSCIFTLFPKENRGRSGFALPTLIIAEEERTLFNAYP